MHRQELLRGPLYYCLVLIAGTLLYWRESPVGILALALMCGGDGLADVVGRQFGTARLPFNPDKSWAGSLAMLLGERVAILPHLCNALTRIYTHRSTHACTHL